MKRELAISAMLIWTMSCAAAPQSQWPLKARTEGPEPVFPVPVIQLSGDGAAMGQKLGQQLGPSIKQMSKDYFGKFFQSDAERQMALQAAAGFEKQIAPEHLAEMRALARQCGVDEREILLANCFLDAVPMVACSTITLPAGASPDNVARFGRNLDFPGFGVAENGSVLLVFHPKDRYAFASVTWPGMIGVLSGMNEHGLTLCSMEVDRTQRPVTGMPYMLLYRTLLERCKTVQDAVALLEKTPRQTANNLMLMDASGNRAVCEITPEKVVVRRAPEDQALVSTNHHRGTDLDKPGRCARFDYLHDSSKQRFGKIDVDRLEAMLGKVAQGDMSIQSMVFEPSDRVIYLAVGANAPTHPYGKLDLKPLLAR